MKLLLLRLLGFLVVLIAAAELFFRFVLPASNTAYKVLDPQFGIMLHDTATTREGWYTTGRLAEGRTHWRINNCGWNSPRDYVPPSPGRKPVVAVIGDSYVAGFMVEQRENLTHVLEQQLAPRYQVYNLGQNGACGSQYVHIARYGAANFDPDVFVFLAKDGDWMQSITNYYRDRRVHQIRYQGGEFVPVPPHYHPTWLSRLPKRSAIIRYLQFNAQFDFRAGLKRRKAQNEEPRAFDYAVWQERYPLVEQGIEYMIGRIRQDHPGKPIVFMANGSVESIYAHRPDVSGSTIEWLRDACHRNACHLLDLGPVFAESYAREPVRFTFTVDNHWNARGHRVVAEALYHLLLREGITSPSEMSMPTDTLLAGDLRHAQ